MDAIRATIRVQTLAPAAGTALRALAQVPPPARADAQSADRHTPSASSVALAPAAMAALLQAQEHMDAGATGAARARSVQQIDHLIARMSDSPPPPAPQVPVRPGACDGFAVQMLMAAREELRQAHA